MLLYCLFRTAGEKEQVFPVWGINHDKKSKGDHYDKRRVKGVGVD
nr:MAG TPA: hypothetical protein [Caudoviricetes sp.]DAM01120.1 MAG TPA: hypothetical protein [Caudoviricetes sp.]